jgi:hypothetical protein
MATARDARFALSWSLRDTHHLAASSQPRIMIRENAGADLREEALAARPQSLTAYIRSSKPAAILGVRILGSTCESWRYDYAAVSRRAFDPGAFVFWPDPLSARVGTSLKQVLSSRTMFLPHKVHSVNGTFAGYLYSLA